MASMSRRDTIMRKRVPTEAIFLFVWEIVRKKGQAWPPKIICKKYTVQYKNRMANQCGER